MSKNLGAIYTPKEYARILTKWAIRAKEDTVLDMGIGAGVFVYQSLERLQQLGASMEKAKSQIYGAEVDSKVFSEFEKKTIAQGCVFENLENINFFNYTPPDVNAIVGNPPYVRRRQMQDEDVTLARQKTLENNPELNEEDIFALTDLYVYFLLTALPCLAPGGRLATIISDSWLNARYGSVLKKYFLSQLQIDHLVSLDRRVFEGAQVKAVLVLATKVSSEQRGNYLIRFSRIRNGLSINALEAHIFEDIQEDIDDIFIKDVEPSTVKPEEPWGVIFKSSEILEEIGKSKIVVPIRDIANVQIGLQTLAKDFFVLSATDVQKELVEREYLVPFAYSTSNFDKPRISKEDQPSQYLFFCSKNKDALAQTQALDYIEQGEKKVVSIRGKGTTTIGYHTKKRIQKANRPVWYDVKTKVTKTAIAKILLPRFIYKDYFPLWNEAGYIPGGAVLQYSLKNEQLSKNVDVRIPLAILTSAFSEIIFRIGAQVYGGGTSNLSITTVKKALTIDISQLSSDQEGSLVDAYCDYLKTGSKKKIDLIVYEILGLTDTQVHKMEELLIDLQELVISAQKPAHPIE